MVLAFTGLCVVLAQDSTGTDGTPDPAKAEGNAKPQPTISPDAQTLLTAMDKAYGDLQGLALAGDITLDVDAGGQVEKQASPFTASYAAPSYFRHEVTDEALAGSTGQDAYVYLPKRSVYVTKPAPSEKLSGETLMDYAVNLLSPQNPSLLMAVYKQPSRALTNGFASVDALPDAPLDGKPFNVLSMRSETEQATVYVDPATRLVRRIETDLTPMLKQRGADDVKRALYTVDYATITAGPPAQPQQFAWTAPDGARDITNAMQEQNPGGNPGAETEALVGKPAPDFTLPALDGGTVKLSALKGKVVVLDFWATWCGPCIISMPKLDAYAASMAGKDVAVIAMNVGEPKQHVAQLVERKGWKLPVALDERSMVAESYRIEAFPTQLVIDKDGVIQKVLIGAVPANHATMERTVERLLK